MKEFLMRHAASVIGILFGFDRLLFRGTLRAMSAREIMMKYLWANQVLLKDFGKHAEGVSLRIKEAAYSKVEAEGRPTQYLESPTIRKEAEARKIAARDKISKGLIALLSCVEPCYSYRVVPNSETKRLELRFEQRRCLHLYRYMIHPVFGFMHVRLQTWFPFQIQVCINGREWLARQMDHEGLAYIRRENCFTRIENIERAQALFERQLQAAWPSLLNGLAKEIHPLHPQIFKAFPQQYYGTVCQSEYATDVMFKSRAELARLYPALVQHGITTFASPDVMRFLGRRVPKSGKVDGRFEGEVVRAVKERAEGVRLIHRVNRNSIKLYDKQAQVLRVETTVNNPADFKA